MMAQNAPTLVDTNVDSRPPVVADDGGLIAGRYSLLRPLGEGGMGNVYLATDRVLARRVAVKTIRAELSGNEEVRARIKRECRLQAAIGTHPNIVTLYDTVEEDGHIYLVMEYVDGETLASRLAASGSAGLPLATALDIVRQILHALACIHEHDIVHRDIKTSNILLRLLPDGRFQAKLTDFGIARAGIEPGAMTRLTSLGVQGPGTPAYMAPERIDSQAFGPVCPATDLYAVGIILYELLAGQPPFTGTMTEIFSGHLVVPPAMTALPAHLPERLRQVLGTALAKRTAERYGDAAGFLAALDGLDDAPAIRLPAHTVQEAEPTVLALPGEEPPVDLVGATVLNPAVGRSRQPFGTRAVSRQGMYAVLAFAFAVLVLASLLLFKQFAPTKPVVVPAAVPQTTVAPAPDIPAAAVPADQAPSPPPEERSALAVVEQARQQKNAEAPSSARAESGSTAQSSASGQASEWQVTEDRTRKIY